MGTVSFKAASNRRYVANDVLPRPARSTTALDGLYRWEPFAALIGLLIAMPVAIFVAITTAILSRRSPFIIHVRAGRYGETLRMLKFRTMWGRERPLSKHVMVEEVADVVPIHKAGRDARVTSSFARWCRRHSVDEIPQLVHVISGQMSLVGPRPITRAELEAYYGDRTEEILVLKPGLVGLWQIMGRNHLTYAQRRRLDLFLVRRASPGLYFYVLIRAIPHVLSGRGAR